MAQIIRMKCIAYLVAFLFCLSPLITSADQHADSFTKAWMSGKFGVDIRYRIESVDQDGFDEEALASTLRTRANYQTLDYKGWQGFLEFEDVRVIGVEDFNSTANGETEFPVVADPEDTELNQVWIKYRFKDANEVKLGRQRINLNNQRFVGAVGFRQNEQTFDAVSLDFTFNERLSGFFAHLEQANRIFGENHPVAARADTEMNTQLIDISYQFDNFTLAGYAHLLDFDDASPASHKNLGARFSGNFNAEKPVNFNYYLEYADQSDHADGLATNEAEYWHAWLRANFKNSKLRFGVESLGGDGVYAFQTPLATLHAFNGAADIFLTTPLTGLVDTYIDYRHELEAFSFGARYHDFQSDTGSLDYGTELDFYIAKSFTKHISGKVEYADYNADDFAVDTRKLWITLGIKF
ncbi:MAG: alginate export family protein [Gammaproteobacteria bacterium]|nr:alginate export family protein [Gammaproteobacteria bacterium]